MNEIVKWAQIEPPDDSVGQVKLDNTIKENLHFSLIKTCKYEHINTYRHL